MLDWLTPSLNVETLDKRIEELKTVQFWLEQNSKAVASSIQVLQVQKMTLETLKGFNLVVDKSSPDAAQAQALTSAWSQLQSQFDSVIQSVIPASASSNSSINPSADTLKTDSISRSDSGLSTKRKSTKKVSDN